MSPSPTFRLYNTLTRRTEPVQCGEPGHLRFYSCGPTVYSFAHIGNFRSFITADLILRTARALGWKTTYVSNVTDVGHLTEDDVADASGEDKMERALETSGQQFANVWDLARFYTEALTEDWHALNLIEPDVRPRATEHMRQQIEAVDQLVEKGIAYETDQGVYFDVSRFPGYGKLSGNDQADQLEESVRDVVQDPEKRDPRDFALWKKDPGHLMQWHSPWGWGFPGWHIECSVMANEYLGTTIDLHAGGEDLIFPHHDCEIAQAESLNEEPFARHWAHTRFLQVEGEKMSKSTGNFFTVRELIDPAPEGKGVDPLALRLTLMSGQYRKPFNFTFETLKANIRHVERFRTADELVQEQLETGGEGDDRIGERLDDAYGRVLAAMCDDLNTPAAIAAALEGVKLIQGMGEHLNRASAERAADWLEQVNDLLGIVRPQQPALEPEADDPLADQVETLLAEREAARKAGEYDRADALRDEVEALGVEVMDTPDGPQWKRKAKV